MSAVEVMKGTTATTEIPTNVALLENLIATMQGPCHISSPSTNELHNHLDFQTEDEQVAFETFVLLCYRQGLIQGSTELDQDGSNYGLTDQVTLL